MKVMVQCMQNTDNNPSRVTGTNMYIQDNHIIRRGKKGHVSISSYPVQKHQSVEMKSD